LREVLLKDRSAVTVAFAILIITALQQWERENFFLARRKSSDLSG